jgi:hypothetical protein
MSWTEITRRQYRRDGLRYASNMTDEEWTLVEPFRDHQALRYGTGLRGTPSPDKQMVRGLQRVIMSKAIGRLPRWSTPTLIVADSRPSGAGSRGPCECPPTALRGLGGFRRFDILSRRPRLRRNW